MGIRINQGESITLPLPRGAELTLKAEDIVRDWLAKLQQDFSNPVLHPDDAAVQAFASAMQDKMALARAKGRSGWHNPERCSEHDLARALIEHVAKGDPVDVANFAMMLHQRGAAHSVLASLTIASGTVPAIGAPWAGQGGIYAGIVRGGPNQPDHYLIIPTHDDAEFENAQLGTYDQDVTGATSKSDGMRNTRALAEAGSELCRQILALEIDDHSDFYLMAANEAHIAAANVPELFEKDRYYWTSTQLGRYNAFVQDFETGLHVWDFKDTPRRARAVRRIQLGH